MGRIGSWLVMLSVVSGSAGMPTVVAQMRKAEVLPKGTTTKIKKQVQNRVAPPPPIELQVPDFRGGAVENVEALTQRLLPQFRPFLREEYLFARRVCQLTPDERKEIALEGERALRAAVSEYARERITMEPKGTTTVPHPRKAIRTALAQALKRRIPADRYAAYDREIEQRETEQKRSIANSVVARLDEELLLTARQRAEIGRVIRERLDNESGLFSEAMTSLEGTYSSLSSLAISPILTSTQREILRNQPQPRTIRQAIGPNGQVILVRPMVVGNLMQITVVGEGGRQGGEQIGVEELVEAEQKAAR